MAEPYDCMVAGHLCLDVIPRFQQETRGAIGEIMQPGKLINVGEASLSTGGPVSNTGINLKKLGHQVCFCACVGDDRLGRITLDILNENGNAEGVRMLPAAASSYTVVLAVPDVDRIFLHNPGTNDRFGPEMLDPELMGRCRHFHFGYPPLMKRMFERDGEELELIFQMAQKAGVTTSCDMTLPDPDSASGRANWRRILERILPWVDLFLPSIEETFYMLHPETFRQQKQIRPGAELIDQFTAADYSGLADEAIALGARVVALKSGHRGFYIKSADVRGSVLGHRLPEAQARNWSRRELWAPALAVAKLASATGSGDCSIAGLLAAFLRGLSLEQSLHCATCLGWQNVQVLDAISGTRSWEETQALLDQRMPLIDPHLKSAKSWHWMDAAQLWFGPDDAMSI